MPGIGLVRQHWQVLLGVTVVIAALILTLRARSRAADLDDERRPWLRDCRGKALEDAMTAAVATIAASMSATQLVHYAQDVVGLHGYLRLLPFGGLDMAAVVCALRARRRAQRGESAGISGALVWILAILSGAFSAGEANTPWAAVGRGIWALIAAILWEIGLAEERHLRANRPDRRLGWVRWLRPMERILVLAELATDEEISADEATRRVRQRHAARKLHALRLADQARADASDKKKEAAQKAFRSAERAAQRAAMRCRLADHDVLAQVQPQLGVLVNVQHIANETWTPSNNHQAPSTATTTAAAPQGSSAQSDCLSVGEEQHTATRPNHPQFPDLAEAVVEQLDALPVGSIPAQRELELPDDQIAIPASAQKATTAHEVDTPQPMTGPVISGSVLPEQLSVETAGERERREQYEAEQRREDNYQKALEIVMEYLREGEPLPAARKLAERAPFGARTMQRAVARMKEEGIIPPISSKQ